MASSSSTQKQNKTNKKNLDSPFPSHCFFSLSGLLSGWGLKGKLWKGKVDPNAVNTGGKDEENKRRALLKS